MIDTDIIFLGSHYSGGRYRFGTKNGRLLPSGFYDTQSWGALDKCWLGMLLQKIKVNLISNFIMHQLYKS
jgi:hypothetical protein